MRKKLEELKQYPERGNHRYSAFGSLKVGDYTIIYEIDKKEQNVIILLLDIKKMYNDFSKLF